MPVTHGQLRELVLSWPGTFEGTDRFGFEVEVKGKRKGICWAWLERVDPKKARVPNDRVLAIRTTGLDAKELLLAAFEEGGKLFTEAHYNGYPAVLARLDVCDIEDLEPMLLGAYEHTKTPPRKTSRGRKD